MSESLFNFFAPVPFRNENHAVTCWLCQRRVPAGFASYDVYSEISWQCAGNKGEFSLENCYQTVLAQGENAPSPSLMWILRDANTLASQRAEAYRLMRLRLSKPDELEER